MRLNKDLRLQIGCSYVIIIKIKVEILCLYSYSLCLCLSLSLSLPFLIDIKNKSLKKRCLNNIVNFAFSFHNFVHKHTLTLKYIFFNMFSLFSIYYLFCCYYTLKTVIEWEREREREWGEECVEIFFMTIFVPLLWYILCFSCNSNKY